MKNAIFVVNIKQSDMDFMSQNQRDSFVAAAERWNVPYIEITEMPKGLEWTYPCFIKLHWPDLCDADRVLVVDADAIIRADAPNPFEIFRNPHPFYAVQNDWPYFYTVGYNPRDDYLIANSEINLINKAHPLDRTLDFQYITENFFNAGVCLESRHHTDLLKYAWKISQDVPLGWWDQIPLNLAVYTYLGNYREMGLTWNHRLPINLNKMEGYIVHMAGDPSRYERLKTVNWRNIE
jgi:hypothetical protein